MHDDATHDQSPPTAAAPGPIDAETMAQVTHGLTVEQWLRHDPRFTYWLTRLLTAWFWKGAFRLRTYGVDNVPRTGAFLYCPNHSSWLDGFLQAAGHTRVMRWMGKKEVFGWPVVRRFMRGGGAFPVNRGASDSVAIDIARLLLLDGQPVVVYAEGTRFRATDALGPPRSGAARLALQTGAPVVPLATWGIKSRRALGIPAWHLRLPRVTTVIGEPMRIPFEPDAPPERVVQVRDEIWAEVTRLYDLARELGRMRRRPNPRRYRVPPREAVQASMPPSTA